MAPRVVLAMSGGVDSSVSAYLLKKQGYDVVGLFMRTGVHQPDDACDSALSTTKDHKKGCCSAVDAGDARRVADRLDIPFYALDFEGDFTRIMDYFVDEYKQGRTPNPCVVCNTWLKFGELWKFAQSLGAETIATGHYARMVKGANGPELHKGADPDKDQSYVLHGIRREVRQLINIDAAVTRDLTQLANQGLAGDAVFQQDLTNLVGIESELTQILTKLNPPPSNG